MRFIRVFFFTLLTLAIHALAAEYHVDADHGDDHNSGLTPEQAWKSLAPVNAKVFQPGDRIVLKSGTTYAGQLSPHGSGSTTRPIELTSFGKGNPPRIEGQGNPLDTLLLHNLDHWFVHGLEITNHGPTTAPFRTGVHLRCDGGHVCQDLHLSQLYVHDVNGDLRKEQEGCGIFFDTRGGASHYDGLLIDDCHIAHTDRNGLCQRSGSRTRSVHVIVRGNLLQDIGGDGIKLWGTDGGLIENNTLRGGRTRCDDFAAGIWPFDCDDTVIQHNEVSGMKGVKDGQGFDSDYVCKRSIFQFNYSHNNDGGFMLLCSPGNSHCDGTIVRYNISQNDGQSDSAVFHIAGNVTHSLIYNNVIYVGPKQDLPLLDFGDWKGFSHHNSFFNNIFYVDGKVTYQWGKSTENIFDFNVYYGKHVDPPKDEHADLEKPPLVGAGKGGDGFDSLSCYRLTEDGRMPGGRYMEDNGGHDFFGGLLPSLKYGRTTVGVAQRPFFIP